VEFPRPGIDPLVSVLGMWYIEHMFDHETESMDSLEQHLIAAESEIARQRGIQAGLLRRLEAGQVALIDGCRSMAEWVSSRLDVSRETASALVRVARAGEGSSYAASDLSDGLVSFERAAAEARLLEAGASEEILARSRGFDLAGLLRMASRLRRMNAGDEAQVFTDRYLALQPNLDASSWRLWGQLPGADGAVVEQALHARGDALGSLPEARGSVSERNADALVSISLDSLTGTSENGEGEEHTSAQVSVFVDASLAVPSAGEAGLEIPAGPRVGPHTLGEMLCNGRVDLTLIQGGTPLGVGRNSRVIPPRLRRYVTFRDGGCVIEGCGSRYRLQAHHVLPFSEGGKTEADNLITLCWHHHHVVIHGYGYRIDPESPPGRRRFLRPTRAP